jgi:ATP-dependent Clp protease ATP-binding subunit ClpA
MRGEFEERLKAVLHEVLEAHPNPDPKPKPKPKPNPSPDPEQVQEAMGAIVLFIDEIHTVVGAGKAEGAMDAGNRLKPEP